MASKYASVFKFSFAIFFVCCLASCQFKAKLLIKPDSTATNLNFIFTGGESDDSPGRLRAVSVYICKRDGVHYPVRGDLLWSAYVPSDQEPPAVIEFAYGQSIVGLKTTDGPAPLRASACYIASAGGNFPDPRGGYIVFYIGSDGKTIDLNPPVSPSPVNPVPMMSGVDEKHAQSVIVSVALGWTHSVVTQQQSQLSRPSWVTASPNPTYEW